MQTFTDFLRWVTGFERDTVADLTPHFNQRLAFLGGLMIFTSLTNTVIITISLAMNGYSAALATGLGMMAGFFTFLVERYIVSSTLEITASSLIYRTFLFLVMIGIHLIFVDLVIYERDLVPIAEARLELEKQAVIGQMDTDFVRVRGSITEIEQSIDALDEERLKLSAAPIEEARGNGSTGKKGPGFMTQFELEQFAYYDSTSYQPRLNKLAVRLAAQNETLDSLTYAVSTIKAKKLDYDELGIATKLSFLQELASRPGQEAIKWMMLLLLLAVGVVEFAPLFARARLEFKEYSESYQGQSKLRAAIAEEKRRTKALLARLSEQVKQAAALENEAYDLMKAKAEDRIKFAHFQAATIRQKEIDEAQSLVGLSDDGRERIQNVFDRLESDLFTIFGQSGYGPAGPSA